MLQDLIQKQYHQQFFRDLETAHGIQLENIIYYKDSTHYFVMTATKDSLLAKGVLKDNFEERQRLLSAGNVDRSKLAVYAEQACLYATGYYSTKLPHTNFALNSQGEPDLSIFDFTNLYAARNSCRAVVRKGFPLLLGIAGDSLLEPFWPDGTGCARRDKQLLSSIMTNLLLQRLPQCSGRGLDDQSLVHAQQSYAGSGGERKYLFSSQSDHGRRSQNKLCKVDATGETRIIFKVLSF